MHGEKLPFLEPETLVEMRSLGVGIHGASNFLLVVLSEDMESVAPMTIQKVQFSQAGLRSCVCTICIYRECEITISPVLEPKTETQYSHGVGTQVTKACTVVKPCAVVKYCTQHTT